jgi:transcriptional regulator with PAS, ATPase and Fis domain
VSTIGDLGRLVESGAFRRDLFYRINVLNIELPPLRDRKRDIPLLVQAFLDRLSSNRGKHVGGIDGEALGLLMDHDYPGNIRELENIVEHAYVLCPGPTIGKAHLPAHFRPHPATPETGSGETLRSLEAKFILDALERNLWNRAATARELGVHKTTLMRRIKRLGLRLPATDGRTTRHATGR